MNVPGNTNGSLHCRKSILPRKEEALCAAASATRPEMSRHLNLQASRRISHSYDTSQAMRLPTWRKTAMVALCAWGAPVLATGKGKTVPQRHIRVNSCFLMEDVRVWGIRVLRQIRCLSLHI